MFDSLSDKLGGIFDGLMGRKSLSEDDVNLAAREIRMAFVRGRCRPTRPLKILSQI